MKKVHSHQTKVQECRKANNEEEMESNSDQIQQSAHQRPRGKSLCFTFNLFSSYEKYFETMLISQKKKVEPSVEETPQFKKWKWWVLFCVMFLYLAAFLSFNSIAAQELAIEKGLNITDAQMGTVYSVYNFPNTVMVLFGGIAFDKLGVRKSTFIYVLVMTMGSALTALSLGPWFQSYYLLLVGRLLYGLGAESTYIALDSIVAIWWFSSPFFPLCTYFPI